jgi:hypothetical protein
MIDAWPSPTPEEVDRVMGLLVDENLKAVFFADLDNPQWLAPLAELGAFAHPAEPLLDDDGIERARPWPEGEYLARMAPHAPEQVSRLLEAVSSSGNPWVHRTVLEAALVLPPSAVRRLVRPISGFVRAGASWVDALDVVALAERLVEESPSQAREVLNAAFQPVDGGTQEGLFGGRHRVGAVIDAYWYAELEPRLVPLLSRLGPAGLRLAVGWLLRAMATIAGDADRRSPFIWRPSIAPHEQNAGIDDISDALIDLVRDLGTYMAKSGEIRETVAFLREQDEPLLLRIAAAITASVLAEEPTQEALALGRQLLMDESLLEMEARPEYVRLSRALLPRLGAGDVAAWERLVRSPSWQGDDELVARIAAWPDREPEVVGDEEIAEARRRILYRLLTPLAGVLSESLESDREAMAGTYGDLQHPEFAAFHESYVGPTSPVTQAELSGLGADELFDYLRTWSPDGDRFFGPSIHGLAREVAAAAEASPEVFSSLGVRMLDLPRSYVRAIIDGLGKALSRGYRPDEHVWEVLRRVAQMMDSGESVTHNFEDDDPVWRWAQRSCVDFASEYLATTQQGPTDEEAAQVWSVVEPLTNHADPTPDREVREDGASMDPLTLSLNTVRPAAIRAAITLMRRLYDRDDSLGPLARAVHGEVASHVSGEEDPSLATAAVIGEGIGHLAVVDRGWLESHSDELFDVLSPDEARRARADVVLSVAIRSYRPNRFFLELMRPALERMVSREYGTLDHTEGWRARRPSVEDAGTQILTGYVTGAIEESDPLLRKLVEGDAAVLAGALGHLGWQLMRSRMDAGDEHPSADILDRARAVVDRVVESVDHGELSASVLSGFYWWARARLFPPTWWLPILRLASSDDEFNPRGLLGKSLSLAAVDEPRLTVEALADLYDARQEEWSQFDLVRNAPAVIAAALTSEDASARSSARALLDRIGRAGQMSVLSDVERLMGAGE